MRSLLGVCALAGWWIAFLVRCTPYPKEEEEGAEILIHAGSEIGKISPLLLGHNCQWIDGGFGLWDPEKKTFRRGVMERLKPLPISCLRFPGGSLANEYRWEEGIGPPESRGVGSHDSGKKKSSHSFGTDEFLQLCETLGAEPLITVNCSTASFEEAARWVEYCNGGKETEEGRRRTQNGHPDPYGVRYWELGNELFHDWQPYHVPPEVYEERFLRFRRAMKEKDPSIRIGAIAPFLGGEDWNRVLAGKVLKEADFVAFHLYAPGRVKESRRGEEVARGLFAFPGRIAGRLEEIRSAPPMEKKPIAVTEFNAFYGKEAPRAREIRDLKSALYIAELLHTFARQGVFMGNFWTLIGSWYWPLLSDAERLIPSPTYYVFLLYGRHFGTRLVRVDSRSPRFEAPGIGGFPPLRGLPSLYCGASLAERGERLYLMAVNRSPLRGLPVQITVKGFSPAPRARAFLLTGPGFDADNDSGAERVTVQEIPVTAGTSFRHSLPPFGVTFLEMDREGGSP